MKYLAKTIAFFSGNFKVFLIHPDLLYIYLTILFLNIFLFYYPIFQHFFF